MCCSRNYLAFQDQARKAQEQAAEDRRTGVIDKLQDEANKYAEHNKETTAGESLAPAK